MPSVSSLGKKLHNMYLEGASVEEKRHDVLLTVIENHAERVRTEREAFRRHKQSYAEFVDAFNSFRIDIVEPILHEFGAMLKRAEHHYEILFKPGDRENSLEKPYLDFRVVIFGAQTHKDFHLHFNAEGSGNYYRLAISSNGQTAKVTRPIPNTFSNDEALTAKMIEAVVYEFVRNCFRQV